MSAQYHFDSLFDKAVDRAPSARHGDIEDTVVPGCKLVVGDNNTNFIVGNPGKYVLAVLKLMAIEPAIRDAAPWRSGIETNQYCIGDV